MEFSRLGFDAAVDYKADDWREKGQRDTRWCTPDEAAFLEGLRAKMTGFTEAELATTGQYGDDDLTREDPRRDFQVPMALMIVGIGLAVSRVENRIAHSSRLAFLVSALAVSMASYGVWQFWWLAALAVSLAALVGVGLPDSEETDTSD